MGINAKRRQLRVGRLVKERELEYHTDSGIFILPSYHGNGSWIEVPGEPKGRRVFKLLFKKNLRDSVVLWSGSLTRLVCLVCALVMGSSAAGFGGAVPLAPIPERTPWTTHYETHQFRLHEARSKARRMAKSHGADQAGEKNATPNMDQYDVSFYDLVFDLNTSTNTLSGWTTVVALVTGPFMTTLDLNFDDNLALSVVRSGGLAVPSSRAGNILTITLDRTYHPGETVTVEVEYAGNPAGNYFGWDSYGPDPMIWTLSEPYGAREWWPCKDLNTDKADSVDITVTVPDNLIAVSNGLLVDETVPAPGKKTYHWQERYPIATYLVSLTAHPYMVLHDEYHSAQGDTMPLDYYIVADRYEDALSFSNVPDMITGFAAAFGEYPFVEEKYGHVHFPWGGGMEHQTMTSLGHYIYGDWIVAHELGHQWFGDHVTCADFGHIWLNEGFATWTEAYWRELTEGMAGYHENMADARFLGAGTIFVEDPSNFENIFDGNLSYNKASWVPHMLRHMLGDDDFFAGVRLYLDTYGNGSATTEQFQAIMEGVSGRDLTSFFQQWIYGSYYPVYEYSWDWWPSGTGYTVSLRVEQTQTRTGLFTMPLDVRIDFVGGTETFVVENSELVEYYHFQMDDPVVNLLLDPDHWVLRDAWLEDVSGVDDAVPGAARLTGNVPNPFNPQTEIRFFLPADQPVRLAVYDVSGRLVKTLVDEARPAGDNAVNWDGTDRSGRSVSAGVYFARLTGAGVNLVRPMSLVR